MANLSRLGIQLHFLQVHRSRLAPQLLARPFQVALGQQRAQMVLQSRSHAHQQSPKAEQLLPTAQGHGGNPHPRQVPQAQQMKQPSVSTRSFFGQASAISRVFLGFDNTTSCPCFSARSTTHHQLPVASIAIRLPASNSPRNSSIARESPSCSILNSRISPHWSSVATCECRLSKSTATSAMLLASCPEIV